MASMITFAANNELFRKRKRVYRACENCKKRRKRCTHTFADEDEPSIPVSNETVNTNTSGLKSPISNTRVSLEETEPTALPDSNSAQRSRSASPAQFLCYSRPEAVLQAQERDPNPQDHECGYWILPAKGRTGSTTKSNTLETDNQALQTYPSLVDVSVLPPKEHLDSLLQIYFTYIHPILPVVDQERPGRRRNGALLSPMLLQAICIVASRHGSACDHLILPTLSSLMEPREFAKRLYKSINAALNAKLEKDRIVLIQVHTLLSLYVEGTDGAEQASLHLVQAVHGAHTLGMQFGRSRADNRAEYVDGLFWCLWGLDRLNSTTAGRPVMVHDRDNRIDSPLFNPQVKYTPFGVWLQLTNLLDKVIAYYRPHNDSACTGWEEEFPGFEDMLGSSADQLDPSISTTLELFYHATAMCSHRSRPITEVVPSTPSYVRQSLSTIRVIQILSKENPEDLSPLPVVPWALSLAMANAYRQFRQSKLSTHRTRAKNDLQICCDLLQKMRSVWWSAGAMADLGNAALKQACKPAAGKKKSGTKDGVNLDAQKAVTVTANDRGPAPGSGSTAASLAVLSGYNPETGKSTALSDFSPTLEPTFQMQTGLEGLPPLPTSFNTQLSPDWMNFDVAFENFDAVLGNSGSDLSMELLRPFNFEDFGAFEYPSTIE
ncbi:hypothetical protein EJ08DRAFT_584845 [Tothia fuscella]|uniref:Xylanolytic transcriptional activator regulatory domain-containing protein n=1 Tax=Tothia fuscella TaxID=1048955 RepID=A0A9P4NWB1_9PEZI|nr:hypothetical protein EJ08DRAFT_584845 [Tothia fuscella]